MFLINLQSVKQSLSYVKFLGPSTSGKLILYDIFLSFEQKVGHAKILGPHTLCKLLYFNHFPKYQTEIWLSWIHRSTYLW